MAFNHKKAAKETGLSLLPLLAAGLATLAIYMVVTRWGVRGGVGLTVVSLFILLVSGYYSSGRN